MSNGGAGATYNLQERAQSQTAAGTKLSHLDDHLAATSDSRGWCFQMEQEFWALPLVLFLQKTAGLCMGFSELMGFDTRV